MSDPDNLDIHFTDDELHALTEHAGVVTDLLAISQLLSRQYNA